MRSRPLLGLLLLQRSSSSGGLLLPNKSINLTYSVSVPANVPPGGYYAVSFAQTEVASSQPGIQVKERVGCVFYLQVAGAAKESGKISGYSTPFLQSSPPSSSILLVNQGSIDYISNVSLTLKDILGTTKDSYQSQKIVLPQTVRRVTVVWHSVPLIALLRVNGTATIFGKSETLPTHFILVVSRTARILVAAILGIVIVLSIVRKQLRARMKVDTTKKYSGRQN